MTNDAPAASASIQLPGYGIKGAAQNRTLQTSNGPYQMESQNGADSGTVSIFTGQYGIKLNTPISKPVTLRASAGPVTVVGHHH